MTVGSALPFSASPKGPAGGSHPRGLVCFVFPAGGHDIDLTDYGLGRVPDPPDCTGGGTPHDQNMTLTTEMNLTLTDSDPDRDPECWMLTIRNDYDSDTTDGHVCIDTMANIHLIDQQYFPYGYDTNGARPIKGVKKNATTYSLGTGDPVLHVKIADRAYALTLRGAHARGGRTS